uniref:Secreted protein n=1 Tax=Haemonchus placei TaxID=6290 RepID=A0A0N4WE06_HAEPC
LGSSLACFSCAGVGSTFSLFGFSEGSTATLSLAWPSPEVDSALPASEFAIIVASFFFLGRKRNLWKRLIVRDFLNSSTWDTFSCAFSFCFFFELLVDWSVSR